jgi:hypothetical protein
MVSIEPFEGEMKESRGEESRRLTEEYCSVVRVVWTAWDVFGELLQWVLCRDEV